MGFGAVFRLPLFVSTVTCPHYAETTYQFTCIVELRGTPVPSDLFLVDTGEGIDELCLSFVSFSEVLSESVTVTGADLHGRAEYREPQLRARGFP